MMTLFVVVAVLLVLVKCSYFYALRFLLLVCLAHTHTLPKKSLLQLSNNSSYLFDAIYVSRTFYAHTRTHTQAGAYTQLSSFLKGSTG